MAPVPDATDSSKAGELGRREKSFGAGWMVAATATGGGQGALSGQDGAGATHTHMTATRNTPCELIEREYPLRVERYAIAKDTGGAGALGAATGSCANFRSLAAMQLQW